MESQQSSHRVRSAVDYNANGHKSNQGAPILLTLTHKLPVSVKELISGGVAGALAKTAVAPLERLKILYQTRRGLFQGMGVVGSLGHIWRKEGFWSFYRGNGASVLRIVPYAGLQFMAYEQYRRWMLESYPDGQGEPVVELLAGGLAGGSAVLLTYPLDVARTRLAYQVNGQASGITAVRTTTCSLVYTGTGDVLRKVYKEGGSRGLYRGVGATLYGILPYAGLKFYVYDILKGYVAREREPSVPVKLACGAVAGLMGQTLTYPLDVVRRQMQVQGNNGLEMVGTTSAYHSRSNIPPLRGTFDGLVKIMKTQGCRQLFAGLSLNYLKLAPSVAIGFTVYDSMKVWLQVPPRVQRRLKETSVSR